MGQDVMENKNKGNIATCYNVNKSQSNIYRKKKVREKYMQYESIQFKVTEKQSEKHTIQGYMQVVLKKSKGVINLKFGTVVTPEGTQGASKVLVILQFLSQGMGSWVSSSCLSYKVYLYIYSILCRADLFHKKHRFTKKSQTWNFSAVRSPHLARRMVQLLEIKSFFLNR